MEKWIKERLSTCLDFEVPPDMIKYIINIKSSEEFDEYFDTLLNKDCEQHQLFLADCKQRIFKKSMPLPNKKVMPLITLPQPKKSASYGSAPIKQHTNLTHAAQQPQISQVGGAAASKKKNKFVSLYASDGKVIGDTIMLKGRRHCDCQAADHKLVNNCMSCGRIVCEQEGSGPCLYCGELVCSVEEQQALKKPGKKSEHLLKSLKEKGGGEALRKALEQRDRLLEYDRNSEKRTTVIDDEFDYFQENSVWLSDEERAKLEKLKQELHEKKHASRTQRKIKVDFAGRALPEDDVQISQEFERSLLQQVRQATAAGTASNWSSGKHNNTDTCSVDPKLDGMRPIYKTSAENGGESSSFHAGLEQQYNRVQDKELLEMQDMRQCLSMHQPYASLLVAGIKKHEGRVWYSEHRGRLWIASTVKEPRTEEIEELESFYKNYYNDPNIKFPQHYPTGCLLGCVKVEDCLAQEEYREMHPKGESESPFVFVCSNPEQLHVVFPIKGQQKIYQLDPKIHNAACKTLLRLKVNKG